MNGNIKDMDHLLRIHKQLEVAGRLHEIHDENGKIKPTPLAVAKVGAEYPESGDAEKWRLAQAQTLIDLAAKYQSELQ